MPYYGPKDVLGEIARLEARHKEILERIALAKQGQEVRAQLLAYVKKSGVSRSDVGWVYSQMPPARITRKSRLKRMAEAQKPRGVGKATKNLPKPELVPIGLKIEAARKGKELSLKEAGAKLGLHPSVLSGYERGKWRSRPEAQAKMEKLYEITIKYPNSNGSK